MAATLRTVLLSVRARLADPELDDPQDVVVARQYQENFPVFKATAQHWSHVYAGSDHRHPEYEGLLRQLQDKGIDEGPARVALSSCDWDLQKATEVLFN